MKLTLNALFDYVNNDGIFTYLNEFDVPWKNAVDYDLLDLDYHSKHGTKVVSKTITSLITPDGLSRDNKTKLAKLLYKKNKAKWDQLWTSIGLFDGVDPLDNTNWTETRTLGHQGSDSRSQSIGAKETTYNKGSQTNSETIGQSTLTEGQQSNITGQQTISMEEKKSAFNSTNYSPLDQKTEELGQRTDTLGEKVNTDSGRSNSTTEGQRSDSTTEGAQSNSETGTNNFTDTETTNRHGNIGVTTTGQLIRDFRTTVNWQFFDIIYKDIDEMLVIEIYGREDDDFDDYTIVTSYVLPVASATKLGGIKVGQNLQIASDGTLKVVMETGVDSVNGKTGVVLLNSDDVGAASSSDLNALSNIVNLQGQTIGQQGQTIDGINNNIAGINTNIGNIEQEMTNIRQVPIGGNNGDVLTKTINGYDWAESSGGGGGTLLLPAVRWTDGYASRPRAFRIDNKTTRVWVTSAQPNDSITQQPIIGNIEDIRYRPWLITNNNFFVWDGKIAILLGNNGSSSNGQKIDHGYWDIFVETTNPQYVNDVTSYWLTYLDVADATWKLDINANVNHLVIGGCQYNSYTGSNKLKVYYTDASDVETELTNWEEHVLANNNCYFIIGKDFDNLFIKSMRIVSASGYRSGLTLGFY